MALCSASGLLSLLNDKSSDVQTFALRRLFENVDLFWPEISEEITKIEALYEDSTFKNNKLAALLASKVYYHLSEFKESMFYALCAEELFDVSEANDFVETINSKIIDEYIRIRNKFFIDGIDPHDHYSNFHRLEEVVNLMFVKCFEHQQFKQGLGIAVESRRLDMFDRSIESSSDVEDMLKYAFKVALSLIGCKGFRNEILSKLVHFYNGLDRPDYVNICRCLIFLEDYSQMADLLEKLMVQCDDTAVIGFQLAFDMFENASQLFLQKIRTAIEGLQSYAEAINKEENEIKSRYRKLHLILSGEKVIELHLQFLIKNNHSDIKLLNKIKEEVRHSVTHNATVIANGLMHFGTTCDQFLRDNFDWLGRSINWAKFTATSTLGVIHKGHEKDALKIMSAYLPRDDAVNKTTTMYTEGGALYALGIIYVNHGGIDMTEYLLKKCHDAVNEPLRHGACLGLGLVAMSTGRVDVYDQLKSNLYTDDAVTGEAAAIAMGLVMVGSGALDVVMDMVTYAKDTTHDKIVRGLALSIALTMYGRQDEADNLIDTLISESCSELRLSAMATIAMAYCGTGDTGAIKRLLHASVSDSSDDVRRWAVTALGFVLFKSPEQLPSLVALLSESFNAHVRYGAAMALGIGCAGTALKEAIIVMEPLLDDSVAFVRQGAFVSMSMLLIQQNKVTCPKSSDLRTRILSVVADRHEDLMTKFGAIVGLGILDAGGRNVTISLKTRTGNTNMCAAVGLLVFQNYWFWYPFTNFISLALIPTCVIILNKELKMPKIDIKSCLRPSVFAYSENFEVEKEKKKEKLETAVLSVSAKQQKKKDIEKKNQTTVKVEPIRFAKSEVGVKGTVDEPEFVILTNPARVMSAQLRVIKLTNLIEDPFNTSRYTTIKPLSHGGILLAVDGQPNQPMDIVEPMRTSVLDEEDYEDEPEPPEPFHYVDDVNADSYQTPMRLLSNDGSMTLGKRRDKYDDDNNDDIRRLE